MMNTKEKIISILENNAAGGGYVSGSKVASELGMSRNAVWKAIAALKDDGYMIEAVPRKGYRILAGNDKVSAAGIEKYLPDDGKTKFSVFKEVSSTNDVVREAAVSGEAEGFCAVSEEQTGGRGRRGRSFYSPTGSGIYFSILLRPGERELAMQITSIAAVAVARAFEDIGVMDAGIKWVNDIFVRGKKVCGILAEATTGMETGEIDYVVVGIGINLYDPEGGFPDEIKDIAGSVFGKKKDACSDARNRVVAGVCRRFFEIYSSYKAGEEAGKLHVSQEFKKNLAAEYKKRCFILGREVTVIKPGGERKATALDIDDECGLLVEYKDGTRETLSSGEISLKV